METYKDLEFIKEWEEKPKPDLEYIEFKGQQYVLEKDGLKRKLYRVTHPTPSI